MGLTWATVQRCVDDKVSIVSSKCSELNVVIPGKKEDDDPVEIPIPEQYESGGRDRPTSRTGAASPPPPPSSPS